jgi:hypothetical protein
VNGHGDPLQPFSANDYSRPANCNLRGGRRCLSRVPIRRPRWS